MGCVSNHALQGYCFGFKLSSTFFICGICIIKSKVNEMAAFRVTIEIAPMDQSRFEQIDALVDTGATYTVVPRDVLERLGITPQFRRRFRVANGRVVELDMAWAVVRVEGQMTYTICVFGEPGTDALLGAFTLEGLGLGVDPVNQRLVPVELLLIGFGLA